MSEDESLVRRFGDIRDLYEDLTTEVQFAIRQRLRELGIKVAELNGRAKTTDSLSEKLARKSYESLGEVPDLAGVRVVTLFESDTETVVGEVERLFHVIEKSDPADSLGVDKMGYAAHHLVVMLGSPGYEGPRYNGIRNLRCEVQVRTLIQDAWAQVSHHLMYKREEDVPADLLRSLNLVAASLESAQKEFDRFNERRKEYRGTGTESGTPDELLALPLNSDSVVAYTRFRFPDRDVSERIHSLLMRDLDAEAYPTLKHLDDVISPVMPTIETYAAEAPELFRFGTDFLTKALGLADNEFRKRHPFGRRTREFFGRIDAQGAS